MLIHRRATPSIKFAATHLYTWVERGIVRVKCLAQEHITMSPVCTRTRTARSGDERINHEGTAPSTPRQHILISRVITNPQKIIPRRAEGISSPQKNFPNHFKTAKCLSFNQAPRVTHFSGEKKLGGAATRHEPL